jgi:hypothetical protein
MMTTTFADFRRSAEALRDQRDELLFAAAEAVRAIAGQLEQIAQDLDEWLSEGRVPQVTTAIGQAIELVGQADFDLVAELASVRFHGDPNHQHAGTNVPFPTLTAAELPDLPDTADDGPDAESEWEDDLRQARHDRRRATADHIRDLVRFADEELLYGRLTAAERGVSSGADVTEAFATELIAAGRFWNDCVAEGEGPFDAAATNARLAPMVGRHR